MPTVGGLSYSIMTGTPDLPGEEVEELARRGRDYARWRRGGLRSQASEVRAVAFCQGAAGVVAAIEAAKALQGQTVTIVDSHEVNWLGCKIERVMVEPIQAVLVNGLARKRVTILYLVRMGEV